MPFISQQKNSQLLPVVTQSLGCVVSVVRLISLHFLPLLRTFCISLMGQAHTVWSSKPISVNTTLLSLSHLWELKSITLLLLAQDLIHFGLVVNYIISQGLSFLLPITLRYSPKYIFTIQMNNWLTDYETTKI
jgi:hypothetical protein